jgi:hypothetical protein
VPKSANAVFVFFVDNSAWATAFATWENAYWPFGPIDNKLLVNVDKLVLAAFKLACKVLKSILPVFTLVAAIKC